MHHFWGLLLGPCRDPLQGPREIGLPSFHLAGRHRNSRKAGAQESPGGARAKDQSMVNRRDWMVHT